MEDSNLWYYLVLAAIYVLSKMFGKKKPKDIPDEVDEYEESQTPHAPKKAPPTFEDILKELTGEPEVPSFTEKEKSRPLEHAKPRPKTAEPVMATELVDYQKKNIEALEEDDMIDIVPHKPEVRKKPEYKRSEHFELDESENEFVEEIHDILSGEGGAQKAIVLSEILNRRY